MTVPSYGQTGQSPATTAPYGGAFVDPEPTNSPRRIVAVTARIITYVLYFYILVVEAVLLLGFLLLLFGANPSSPFVQWAYRNLERTMEPFRGIFAPIELGVAGNDVPAVFETSIVFAMVVYGIVALVIHAAIDWLTNRIAKIDRDDRIAQLRARAEQEAALAAYQTNDPLAAPLDPPGAESG